LSLRVFALCGALFLSSGCEREPVAEELEAEPSRPVVQGQAHGLLVGAQYLKGTFQRLRGLEGGAQDRFLISQLGASHTENLHFTDEISERLGAKFGSLGPGYIPLISTRPHFVEPASASERSRVRVHQEGWNFATALYAKADQIWGLSGTRAVAAAGALAVFEFEYGVETQAPDAGTPLLSGSPEELGDAGGSLQATPAPSAGESADAGESLHATPAPSPGESADAGESLQATPAAGGPDAGSREATALAKGPPEPRTELASFAPAPAPPDGGIEPERDGGLTLATAPVPVPGQLQVFYLDSPAAAQMQLTIDGVRHSLPAHRGTRGPRIARYPLTAAPRRVELLSPAAGATVYGIAYERTGSGLVYDVLGLSGSSVYVADRYQAAGLFTQVRARQPALYVLFFGTNESVMSKVTPRDFRARYRSLVQKLGRRATPGAECLLITNTDREVAGKDGGWEEAPNAALVEEEIRTVAALERCAYWSARAAMGGAGGMRRWMEQDPPLALPDRTHLTELGYRVLAAALVEDLLGAYGVFASTAALRPPRTGHEAGRDGIAKPADKR